MNKKVLSLGVMLMLSLCFVEAQRTTAKTKVASEKDFKGYLFAYFSDKGEDKESIYYALSTDGYNYKALNSGLPVIRGAEISDKGGVRDPHILRGADGRFYMVVTDMKASQGWESNHGIVLLRSNDLINWTSSKIDIKNAFPKEYGNITRAWAPQTIYDEKTGKYMVYFSMKEKGDHPDIIYYAYTNADFTAFEEAPKKLFSRPQNKSAIDGDIIYKDGKFYLFFKTEGDGNAIQKAVSDKLTGGYVILDKTLQQTDQSVEGACVFKLINQKKYILMYDVYKNKRYEFTESEDLDHFRLVPARNVSMDFAPRHGTVIPVTANEIKQLTLKWGK